MLSYLHRELRKEGITHSNVRTDLYKEKLAKLRLDHEEKWRRIDSNLGQFFYADQDSERARVDDVMRKL